MFGVFQDITERKQAELALQESEANFHIFFETIGDLIVVATPEGRILFTNQAVQHKLGYTAQELAALHLLDLHPANQRREARNIFAAILRGERDTCPLPLATKSGALIPAATRVWFGQWNGAKCVFGTIKDLSAEQEAQQRFERLFRHNPALMALTTLPDRRFFDVNDAFLKTLGYCRQEILGKTSAELGLFPRSEHQAEVADKLRTFGRLSDLELQVRCKDGTLVDGLFSGEIITNQSQQYFLTVMIDITARKQAEAALQRAHGELEQRVVLRTQELRLANEELRLENTERRQVEAQLREAQAWLERVTTNAPIVLWAVNRQGVFIVSEGKALELLRLKPGEVVGQSVFEFYRQEPGILRDIRRALAGGTFTSTNEIAGLVFETNYVPLRGDAGKIIGALGVSRDITERKRTEAALNDSEKKFRTLFEGAPVGILVADLGTKKFLAANATICRLLGYSEVELLQLGVAQIHPPENLAQAIAIFEAQARGETIQARELACVRKDRTHFCADISATLLPFAGRPTLVGFFTDATERKHTEVQLEASRQQLRALLTKLQNLREEEQTRIAREVHDVLGQQVTAFKMDLAWLARRLPKISDEPVRGEFQEKLQATTELTTTMLESVRHISRRLRPSALDQLGLEAALQYEAREFQERTGILCRVTVPSQLLKLHPDQATGMYRIFQEILTNVVRHAQATEVSASLSRARAHLILEVRDNGCGISAHAAHNPKSLGLLGMTERATLLHGKLQICRGQERGTIVTLTLPVRPAR
ncbi:MAG: PAS domain S-box protein [Verrucomicrobiota bacterium]